MASRPINLILDWDGTITVKDTMFAYGKIADIRDARLNREPNGSKSFERFGKAWMDDYSAHERTYSPKAHDRKQAAQESAWLKSLSIVETSSAERVERSGFFYGVTHSDVATAADELLENSEVSLRAGWDGLFLRAYQESIGTGNANPSMQMSVLSVNWSEAFIRTSLRSAASRSHLDIGLQKYFDHLKIAANEINGLDQPGGSNGRLTDPNHAVIRTSFDKLQNLQPLAGHCNIYVGDSATDFDCLSNADLGICIRDEQMGSSARTLADTFSRIGTDVRHVNKIENWQGLNTSGPNILWAKDFNEITDLLKRLQRSYVGGQYQLNMNSESRP